MWPMIQDHKGCTRGAEGDDAFYNQLYRPLPRSGTRPSWCDIFGVQHVWGWCDGRPRQGPYTYLSCNHRAGTSTRVSSTISASLQQRLSSANPPSPPDYTGSQHASACNPSPAEPARPSHSRSFAALAVPDNGPSRPLQRVIYDEAPRAASRWRARRI
ncbi:hypothetical protein C8R44DRAFT_212030 [Mycena epipterygia]|nr:hypothetical protein C8R44DRAFT_212030 [Mycena epipterygia]